MRHALAVLAFLLTIGGCTIRPPEDEVRARVAAVESYRTLGGDIRHWVTLEFTDATGATNHQRVEVDLREWLLFGREGADVCLHRWGGGWRMDRCR